MEQEEIQARLKKLEEDNRQLLEVIESYKQVLRLNEKELSTQMAIVSMYENAIEYSRSEMIDFKETISANERVAQLCDEEKKQVLAKIRELTDNKYKITT
ncbi:MAG: hypothetical protein PF637_03320 [Spirochaetes bacterium]|jgi:chromosome segregation ATPase|nr:hypothetical protein [Spirochaetota bacterium]